MVKQKNYRGKEDVVVGRPDAPRTILLFHGYTGSSGDFGELPEYLAKELDALVLVPLLPGHGKTVKELLPISFEDFLSAADSAVKMCIARGKPYALGGHSFGSYLAVSTATSSNPVAVVLSATPYHLRFRLSFWGAMLFARLRPTWKKYFTKEELRLRQSQFFYTEMPGKALSFVKRGNTMLSKVMASIHCPLLTMHVTSDPLAHADSGTMLTGKSSSTQIQNAVFNENLHGIFSSEARHAAFVTIAREYARAFGIPQKTPEYRVTAVVPVYNEHKRIGKVLEVLTACSLLSEIIVVDDGSSVRLDDILKNFPTVRCIRHEKNKGKAEAMETGVRATEAEFIFFCDGDLENLRPEDVEALIVPVTSGSYRMSIGIRDNPEQRAIFLFALNSGERCLSRADWLSLPAFYKKGFRIEAGLNMQVWLQGGRLFHHRFSYRQTVRERKYGFFAGFKSRIRLSFDVGVAWIYALINGLPHRS
ncbi:MAG: hypothetical protein COV91_04105 [Candidatus Taylorbacteria bacterium CG11_big_fil_rev_8_21_14_0_20_46_11]|uniref:Glycosyltransferase 2-like domain-containing protein n=1 Tax=Candidatus Taylorbacteria bacterium CG11_big_fil_rev_8_21_14_0_20_46_11 TaxID=1975025 RepID=A0A2H0KAY2_9BACT|nr:MAG: hypothetical protein COV91_04105 [Candidatus Taylorbacteria bacterium CG11_big_fil_rev_8_21_14_0_20_46_11]